jgi:hypothetical protein
MQQDHLNVLPDRNQLFTTVIDSESPGGLQDRRPHTNISGYGRIERKFLWTLILRALPRVLSCPNLHSQKDEPFIYNRFVIIT